MKVRMKALKRQAYAGKVIEPGESFDADSDHDARILTIVGNAERFEEETKRKYRTRDMRAEH